MKESFHMINWKFAKCGTDWWLVVDDLEHFLEYHEQMDGNYVANFVLASRQKTKEMRRFRK
jgi:hypothetical protein